MALTALNALGLIGVMTFASGCARSSPKQPLKSPETGLRAMLIDHPRPDYPASSIARGSIGVAVAAIRVGTRGDVERVNVLQAPDPEIAASVHRTLSGWRFAPPRVEGSPEPRSAEGKLTFYFQIRDGRPSVEEPQSAARRQGTPRRQGWVLDVEPTSTVDDHTLASLLRTGDAVLVNVANREAVAKATQASINIPSDELTVRAPRELPRDKTIVLECIDHNINRCAASSAALQSAGFADVRVWQPQASSPVGAGARR